MKNLFFWLFFLSLLKIPSLLAYPIPTEPPFGGDAVRNAEGKVFEALLKESPLPMKTVALTYPFPNGYNKWVDEIERHLQTIRTLKDEEKACYNYFFEQELSRTIPENIEKFPRVVQKLQRIGIKVERKEMFGLVHEPDFKDKIVKDLPYTYCGRLVRLEQRLQYGDGVGAYEVSQKVFEETEAFLKEPGLPARMKSIALFFQAEAKLAQWLGAVKKDIDIEECRVKAVESPEKNKEKAKMLFQRIVSGKGEFSEAAQTILNWIEKGKIEGRYTVKYCIWYD